MQDYKNCRWPLHHYRGQARLQAAMKTADQTYQELDNVLKPLCGDVFVKSQPVSLFTALLAACVEAGGKGQAVRTRDVAREDGNLEKIMGRKGSAPCAVGVCLHLTQCLGNTFVKKSSPELSEKLGLGSLRHLFLPGSYVNEAQESECKDFF